MRIPIPNAHRCGCVMSVAVLSMILGTACRADEPAVQTKELKLLQLLHHDDLNGICDVELSADGHHLYAPSFVAGTITHFAVDPENGRLRQHVATIRDQSLPGTTDFQLFPNGKLAVSVACHAQTVVLYNRNVENGRLSIAQVFNRGAEDTYGLDWPVHVTVSPDGKFVYVGDSKSQGKGRVDQTSAGGAVAIFSLTDDSQLNWIDSNFGEEGCFGGTRGVLCHPNGQQVLVATNKASTLVMCDRDSDTGLLQIRQVSRNGGEGIECLSGALSSCLSPDGRSIYTCAGRFNNTGGIGVFRLNKDGTASFEQQFINGQDRFDNFIGGNRIIVSPDGRRVYASATVSGSLAVFERDLETGRLTHIETLISGKNGVQILGANGMAFSPGGKYLYLACEEDKGIAVFEMLRAQKEK